jgi:flagellar biosynthesis component FlhA
MDALVPKSAKIEMHFAPGYLREVTDSHDVNPVENFYGPRQAMYDKFGISLPGFKFIENPTLKPRSFALRLNAHLLKPWVGLPSASEVSTPQAQLEYIVDTLVRDLCANLHCLFPRWYADDYVSGLDQVFPTLLRMVKDRFDQTQQARVLRTLLADQIPLRNLRLILERMLDYEGDPNDLDRFDIFVRAGIARQSG